MQSESARVNKRRISIRSYFFTTWCDDDDALDVSDSEGEDVNSSIASVECDRALPLKTKYMKGKQASWASRANEWQQKRENISEHFPSFFIHIIIFLNEKKNVVFFTLCLSHTQTIPLLIDRRDGKTSRSSSVLWAKSTALIFRTHRHQIHLIIHSRWYIFNRKRSAEYRRHFECRYWEGEKRVDTEGKARNSSLLLEKRWKIVFVCDSHESTSASSPHRLCWSENEKFQCAIICDFFFILC